MPKTKVAPKTKSQKDVAKKKSVATDTAPATNEKVGGWDSEEEEKECEAMLIHDRLNVKPTNFVEKWLKGRERDTQIRMAAETMSQAEWTHCNSVPLQ